MKQILELNKSESGTDISIYYKKIEMTEPMDRFLDFAQVFYDNEPYFLQFAYGQHGIDEDTDTLKSLCNRLPLLQSIRVEGIPLSPMQCFISFQQLTNLSLENINLNGQLVHLCDLNTSLISLMLFNCCLNDEDLDILSSSHHTVSLQYLNLSTNRFTDPSKDSVGSSNGGLLGLVEKLTRVRMLNLNQTDLQLWCDLSLQMLVNSLRDQPMLTILNLLGPRNQFSDRVMITIMSRLVESESLKLISLEFPSGVSDNQSSGFHLRFLKTLHEIRGSDDLQVVSGQRHWTGDHWDLQVRTGHNHVTVIANLDFPVFI